MARSEHHRGDIQIGSIKRNRRCTGTAWVRCPVEVARTLLSGEKSLVIGLARVKVELLPARPLQCHKCLEYGHVRQGCSSSADYSGVCYRCGTSGHTVASCKAEEPKCAPCSGKGRQSNHRMGTSSCPHRQDWDTSKKRRGKRRGPPAALRSGGATNKEGVSHPPPPPPVAAMETSSLEVPPEPAEKQPTRSSKSSLPLQEEEDNPMEVEAFSADVQSEKTDEGEREKEPSVKPKAKAKGESGSPELVIRWPKEGGKLSIASTSKTPLPDPPPNEKRGTPKVISNVRVELGSRVAEKPKDKDTTAVDEEKESHPLARGMTLREQCLRNKAKAGFVGGRPPSSDEEDKEKRQWGDYESPF